MNNLVLGKGGGSSQNEYFFMCFKVSFGVKNSTSTSVLITTKHFKVLRLQYFKAIQICHMHFVNGSLENLNDISSCKHADAIVRNG